ncbi:MAG: DNA replication/repair protein RecF [Firmicutes bacterium]|nr:DNA replication/repair protein RecF [Bacillota bacterium]
MNITRVSLSGFRNLTDTDILTDSGINVFYGSNAQGKTNLLEAIWLFSGLKSFRGKDSELINYERDSAKIKIDFNMDGRDQTAEMTIAEQKKVKLNGVPLKSAGELTGNIRMIIFSPTDLSLIKDGPDVRRRFIDNAISQLWPKYVSLLSCYRRAVTQRNSIMRDVRFHASLIDMLDVYEREIASTGAAIIKYRQRYVELINEFIENIYAGISSGREHISVEYSAAAASAAELYERLQNSRRDDIAAAVTSVGPHRDDLIININDHSARSFASQGQQRSAVLTLKMCEAAIIKKVSNCQPIALLDDVMSELDASRQDYILNHIKDWQVFLTCCDKNTVDMMRCGALFYVENGRVSLNEG